MTVPVPSSATKNKITFLVWKIYRKIRYIIHSYKRNPNCNERRRYRNDTKFVAGEHKHLPPLIGVDKTGKELQFEQVSVPFKPLRFDGPAYSNGLILKEKCNCKKFGNCGATANQSGKCDGCEKGCGV